MAEEDEEEKFLAEITSDKKDCNQVETSKTFQILLVFVLKARRIFASLEEWKIYQK